jgi:uncharacterized Tic20 family protein
LQRWWDGSRWTEHVQGIAQRQQPQDSAPVITADPSGTTNKEARNWAVGAHLSALVAVWLGFGFLGPLIVYLIKKDDHPYIRQQAAEALNFNLSVFIYAIVGGVIFVILLVLLVGILLIPFVIAAAIGWLVLVILAATKASKGEPYRYPLTIRFVN